MQEVFEKIIEKLEEECFLTTNDDGETNELSIKVVDLNDAIEIVKQEVEKFGRDTNVGSNGWIPCSERLPKYGEVVMCCCENGGITVSCITHKCVKLSKFVWFGQHRVIAWKPLPAPYQPSEIIRKKTNFDRCCESMEAMAQIIDIAKIGWTKEQIMEWLQKEECEVPE